MKNFSVYDQIYICKYSEKIPLNEIAYSLGTNVENIKNILDTLKKNGIYEQYIKISDEDWEKTDKKKTTKKQPKDRITLRLNPNEDKEIIEAINKEDKFGNTNVSKNIKGYLEKAINKENKVDYLKDSTIEVPISVILDYYYLKGYLKGIEST